MKPYWLMIAFAVAVGTHPAGAQDFIPPTTSGVRIDPTTIAASAVIAPGRYSANITPDFDKGMAKRLRKALGSIPGVTEVEATSRDGMIRFTITEGSQVSVGDIQSVVAKTNNGAVVSTPVLAGTLTPRPY